MPSLIGTPRPLLRIMSAAQVRSPPVEGVYIHGLFLDGAAWSKQEGVMVESEPKKLFVSLPVLYVSANTKSDQVRPKTHEYPTRRIGRRMCRASMCKLSFWCGAIG